MASWGSRLAMSLAPGAVSPSEGWVAVVSVDGTSGMGSDPARVSGEGADSRAERCSTAPEGATKEAARVDSAPARLGDRPPMLDGRVGGVHVPSSFGRDGARLMSMTAPKRSSRLTGASAVRRLGVAEVEEGVRVSEPRRSTPGCPGRLELPGRPVAGAGRSLGSTGMAFLTDWRRPKGFTEKSATRAEPDLRRSGGGGGGAGADEPDGRAVLDAGRRVVVVGPVASFESISKAPTATSTHLGPSTSARTAGETSNVATVGIDGPTESGSSSA